MLYSEAYSLTFIFETDPKKNHGPTGSDLIVCSRSHFNSKGFGTHVPQYTLLYMIRKSAYGRTELFLPSKGTILREVKCMGGFGKQSRANIYHVLPSIYDEARSVCCWHCCELIDRPTNGIPLPRIFENGVYYVYGITCSPGCAKAYILEHTSFDRGQQLNVFTHMLRDVYGITDAVLETPPRASLRRFGGPFDALSAPRTECKLVQPPFVSYCMIVEERSGSCSQESSPFVPNGAVEDHDAFEEPFPPALYNTFINERNDDPNQQSQRSSRSSHAKKSCRRQNQREPSIESPGCEEHQVSNKTSTLKRRLVADTSSELHDSSITKKKITKRQGPLSKFVS